MKLNAFEEAMIRRTGETMKDHSYAQVLEMLKYSAGILKDLPPGDPAFEHFYNEVAMLNNYCSLLHKQERDNNHGLCLDVGRFVGLTPYSRNINNQAKQAAEMCGYEVFVNPRNRITYFIPGKEFEEQVLLDLLRDINVTYRFLPEELARI